MDKVKIKKRVVYNVLFMRDDSDVLRFRMSAAWLKFFVYTIIVITGVAIGGTYLSYYFWNKTQTLEAEIELKNTELKPLQAQMGKIDRLNSFAKAIDEKPPVELQPILQEIVTHNSTVKSFATISTNSTNATSSLSSVASLSATNATLAADTNSTSQEQNNTNLVDDNTANIQNNVIEINSFSSKFINDKKLRISFGIVNKTKNNVAGEIKISLLINGSQTPVLLSPENKFSSNFKINYSKDIILTYVLPNDLTKEEIGEFLLQVENSENEIIHTEKFQI
ncbi:hypothetical protein [Desulfovibrio litoralis]|uniref:Uncharacterized protein n=1 Tax=Desulfovibrio litoralis DSM 11393 TaxID=1121455 RepID=A0A1M7SXR9_9BACT|nr:hypothetical protein [Desulfovibrio litoralis]SHN63196.1 hypothetical protein SAMN02745728_01352 [Desulfovibrio litoralis DSM 11393]